MTLTLALAALILSAPPEPAQGKEGYQNVRWGMSRDQVKKLRSKAVIATDGSAVEPVDVGGRSATAGYVFSKAGGLAGVLLQFKATYMNANKYVEDFEAVHALLEKKYGRPVVSGITWSNSLYEDDAEHLGLAISMGHAKQAALWETTGTRIYLLHSGEAFKNTVAVIYQDKAQIEEQDAEHEAGALESL